MNEVRRAKNTILFIDELHTLVGAGGAEGAIDASNVLKPALARGEVQCIGATTLDEYRKYIEKDGALERRFQTIVVEPPSKTEALEILRGLRDRYEAHHRVQITDEALEAVDRALGPLHHRPLPPRQGDRRRRRGRRPRPPQGDDPAPRPEGARRPDRAAQPGQGRGRRQPGLRARRRPARPGRQAQEEEGDDQPRVARALQGGRRHRRRGGRRRGRQQDDRHPPDPARGGGDQPPAEDGGGDPEEGHLADRGDQADQPGRPPEPFRPEGPQAADRLLHLRRADRRREDPARQGPGRVHVRRLRRPDPDRHVGVHGEAQRLAAHRRPAGLRRLRGGRPAHREDPPPPLRGGPARRDREGAPRRLQHAPPDHGGRPADRQLRPQRRLQEHDHHHDHQRRGRGDLDEQHLRLRPRPRRRRELRDDEGAAQGLDRAATSAPSSSTGSTT